MNEYKSCLPEISLKYKSGEIKKIKITQSSDIFKLSKELLNKDTVELAEEFLVIYLNRANNTIGWLRLSQGGISGTVADQRLILATAIKCGASAIICIHNHPSGNMVPSIADINITKKIKEGGIILDITLLDHLIIAGNLETYYSFADEGIL